MRATVLLQSTSKVVTEEGASEAFCCESQVVLAECCKCEDELHVAGALDLRTRRPIEALYPNPDSNRAVEGVLLGEFDLEVSHEVHACIVSIDRDFVPEVLL